MVKKSEKDTWRICLGPDVLRKGNSNAELFEAITKKPPVFEGKEPTYNISGIIHLEDWICMMGRVS